MLRVKGFSTTNILITLALVGILAAVGIPTYQDYARQAYGAKVLLQANTAKQQVEQYYLKHGTLQGATNSFTLTTDSLLNSMQMTNGQVSLTTHATNFGRQVQINLYPVVSNGKIEWTCQTDGAGDYFGNQCGDSLGTTCTGDQVLSNGVCTLTCSATQIPVADRCIDCPNTQIAVNNGSTWACGCASGYVLNSNTGLCQQDCPSGQIWDAASNNCVAIPTGPSSCASGTYWNGSSCVTCGSHQSWNATTLACEDVCPIGQNWSGTTCVTCSNAQVWTGSACIDACPNGSNWNGVQCIVCPGLGGGGSQQVWNGTSCGCYTVGVTNLGSDQSCYAVCAGNQTWNASTHLCECSGGKEWNSGTQLCECPVGLPNEGSDGSCYAACNSPLEWNAPTNSCVCPAATPNLGSDGSCYAACSTNHAWDADTNSCICPAHLPNEGSDGMCYAACNTGRVWRADRNQCRCPGIPGYIDIHTYWNIVYSHITYYPPDQATCPSACGSGGAYPSKMRVDLVNYDISYGCSCAYNDGGYEFEPGTEDCRCKLFSEIEGAPPLINAPANYRRSMPSCWVDCGHAYNAGGNDPSGQYGLFYDVTADSCSCPSGYVTDSGTYYSGSSYCHSPCDAGTSWVATYTVGSGGFTTFRHCNCCGYEYTEYVLFTGYTSCACGAPP